MEYRKRKIKTDLKVRFFGKIGFLNPKTDFACFLDSESKVSTLEEDTSDQI